MNNPMAFPVAWTDSGEYGMTLLDYFAGQVLAGICSNTAYLGRPNDTAGHAYFIAAAMLRAREVALRELGGADGAG